MSEGTAYRFVVFLGVACATVLSIAFCVTMTAMAWDIWRHVTGVGQ